MSGYNKLSDSLLKSDRGNVNWGRYGIDGVPFRSQGPVPFLTEDEYQQNTTIVGDCRFGTFNTSTPDQEINGRTYQQVLEGITSGVFELLHRQHMPINGVMTVYIEWRECFIEPVKKAPQIKGTSDASTKFL